MKAARTIPIEVAREPGRGRCRAVEVPITREALRAVIAGMGYPHVAMRLGIADAAHVGPPHTPRMPANQVIDTSPVRPPGS